MVLYFFVLYLFISVCYIGISAMMVHTMVNKNEDNVNIVFTANANVCMRVCVTVKTNKNQIK